ncbi:MAG: hypothetical protein VX938_03255, partial [Myxococcota bacterium]|nr:hypothetical protein [Myxococcota bacterium]
DSANRLELAEEGVGAVPLLAAAVRRSSYPVFAYARLVVAISQVLDEGADPEIRSSMEDLVTTLSVELLLSSSVHVGDLLQALPLAPGSRLAYGERILANILSSPTLPLPRFIEILESLHGSMPRRAHAAATRALGGGVEVEEGSLERARILRLAGFSSQARAVAASLVDHPTDGAGACVLLARLTYESGETAAGGARHWLLEAVRRAAVPGAMAIEVAAVALAAGDVHGAQDLLPSEPGEVELMAPWARVRMALELDGDTVDRTQVRRHVSLILVAEDHPTRQATLQWLFRRLQGVAGLDELRGELMEALFRALPDDPVLAGRLAGHRMSEGDVEGAIALWLRAREGATGHQFQGDDLYVGLARKLMGSAHVEEGFSLLLGSPVNTITSPDLLLLMAELCLQRARPLWAQAYVDRLLSAHYSWAGKNRGKLKTLAARLLAAGEAESAVECWKRVLSGRPRDPQVMVGLGEAMLAAGR